MLYIDYAVPCDTTVHAAFQAVALAVIVLFSLGVPLWRLAMVARVWRQQIELPEERQQRRSLLHLVSQTFGVSHAQAHRIVLDAECEAVDGTTRFAPEWLWWEVRTRNVILSLVSSLVFATKVI